MVQPNSSLPLCVDLDGTLCQVDTFIESILRVLRFQLWSIFFFPFWLLRGKAYFKAKLSTRGLIDATLLPYNPAVVDLIVQARNEGRYTLLISGCNIKIAEKVNAHLKLFDEVIASDNTTNLTGARKAEFLLERFGLNSYEYLGNSSIDLPVWKNAGKIVTVNTLNRVIKQVERLGKPHLIIPRRVPGIRTWLKAIRVHQWAKNTLLFIPLITSHRLLETGKVYLSFLAFLSFGLCASATYIINDLLDLEADRSHPKKKQRPFAAGIISAEIGIVMSSLLLATGFLVSLILPMTFRLILLTYLASTLLYSFYLKKISSLDVIVLAGLYTLRIVAGAFAIGVRLSFWLLAFSMFIFLSLALVKRVAELIELDKRVSVTGKENKKIIGREYYYADISILQIMGASSGYLSVLVLALYINSIEVSLLYKTPELLWFIIPLILLWVTRLWVVTSRGYMHDDPIVFAIKDPETWITASVMAVFIALSTMINLKLAG